MNYVNIFKIYSLKLLKKEKILFIFTALSIVLNICISLTIPQIELCNRNYLENNIEEINGGDLQIAVKAGENKEFDSKIDELKEKGIEVNTCYGKRATYNIGSNKIVGTIILDNSNIDDDEIILSSVIASNMKIGVGDNIKINIKQGEEKEFTVKEIETIAKSVDKDSEILGYGKINSKNIDISNWDKRIFLKGKDGDPLKEELENIAPSFGYTTLEEKRNSVKDSMAMESISLGILSTVTYGLSTICIITTTMMLLIKRKRDIAIFRMLSIKLKDIKMAVILELMLWITPSIILGAMLSFPISKAILRYKCVLEEFKALESLLIIGKGIIFNLIVFIIITFLFVRIIGSIKPLAVFRDDKSEIRRKSKVLVIEAIMVIPIIILSYSFIISDMGSFIGLITTSAVIILLLILIGIILKIISRLPWRKTEFLYAFKSIRKNLLSFILVILSVTMTLWFILIGFYLNDTLKNNMNETIKAALPYNYEISTKEDKALESILSEDKNINGYDKSYDIQGEIKDTAIKKMHKNISLCEIDKDNYKAKFNIVEGENLFEGNKEGVIISDDMYEKNRLNLGDSLNITTKNGDAHVIIKGVYKSSGINANAIYKEDKNLGEEVNYYINASSDEFLDKISDAEIYNIKDIGDKFVASLLKFLNVFKILTVVTIISTILFNVNMINMNHSLEEKDEAIISCLGIGNKFLQKVKVIKIATIVILSSILSVGIFSFLVKLSFKALFKYDSNISIITIFIVIITSIIITITSFKLCENNKDNLNLLRE